MDERAEFCERIRRQVVARYRDQEVVVNAETFAVELRAPGIDVSVPLAPLYHQCRQSPGTAVALITRFVADIESKLNLTPQERFDMGSVLWCLRTRKYLEGIGRADELMTRAVAGDLVAFVAQPLPLKAMRGVARSQWLDAGHDDDAVRQAAGDNTEQRFGELLERVHKIDRIPADGWRISVDELFCSSAILLTSIRAALVDKAQSEVLLAAPDRSVVLVLPVNAAAAQRFGQRVTREWREAMNPCSRQVLVTEGDELRLHAPVTDRASQGLMGWLRA